MSKKHIADIWIEALRSGEYQQAKNELQSPEGFCCLGVLAAEVEKAGLYTCRRRDDDRIDGTELSDQENLRGAIGWNPGAHNCGTLSRSKIAEAFPGRELPGCDSYGVPGAVSLTQLNDTAEWNFQEIADLIETFKSELFNLDSTKGWVEVEDPA